MSLNIEKLKRLADKIVSYEVVRKKNLKILKELYHRLDIDQKVENFEKIFDFKAMNLSGVSLNESDFCKIQEGKYIQIIAIEKNRDGKNKNVNIRYFGRAEKVDSNLLTHIVEFVLRWRVEKSFKNSDHYINMIKKVEEKKR